MVTKIFSNNFLWSGATASNQLEGVYQRTVKGYLLLLKNI